MQSVFAEGFSDYKTLERLRMFTRLLPYFPHDTHLIKHKENNYLVVNPRPFEVAA